MESRGECERNRDAMSRSCRRTCQRCVDVPDGCIDISPDHNGGIYKCVLQSGYGDERAPAGSVIYSHYHGELPDGSVFGTSRDAGRMWTYNIGVSTFTIKLTQTYLAFSRFYFISALKQVIDGWVYAVPTMQRGEVAKVTMQSEYAYGASGNNVIPPTLR